MALDGHASTDEQVFERRLEGKALHPVANLAQAATIITESRGDLIQAPEPTSHIADHATDLVIALIQPGRGVSPAATSFHALAIGSS